MITKLTYSKDFESFKMVGLQGNSVENINGKAVAIEDFLDFNSVDKPPCVRWTSYNVGEKKYQGELINKII